jgi:hypothetical protein
VGIVAGDGSLAPDVRLNRAGTEARPYNRAMIVRDLGLMPYREAWSEQERVHAAVVEGAEEQLLLVEHPPVVTLGRRPGVIANLVASSDEMKRRGVELVESDRGGDITFPRAGADRRVPDRPADRSQALGRRVRAPAGGPDHRGPTRRRRRGAPGRVRGRRVGGTRTTKARPGKPVMARRSDPTSA